MATTTDANYQIDSDDDDLQCNDQTQTARSPQGNGIIRSGSDDIVRDDDADHDACEFSYFEPKYKPLSEVINTSEFLKIQLLAHKLVSPLVALCDHSAIRTRAWLQIPLIKYCTCITSMIIGIALSQLVIKMYEVKATTIIGSMDHYDLNDVIYFLVAYVILITTLCALSMYAYYKYHEEHGYYAFNVYHYHYFVMTCSGIIGFGILYLLIHIQSQFYSTSLHSALNCFAGASVFAISCLGIVILIKQFLMDFEFKYTAMESEYDTDEDYQYERQSLLRGADAAAQAQYDEIQSPQQQQQHQQFEHSPSPSQSPAHSATTCLVDEHIDDEEQQICDEYREKGILWFTIGSLVMNVWHIAIGLVMIECVVFAVVGGYVNLLMDWTHTQSTNIGGTWSVIVFGFCLTFVTAVAQIALQTYCKAPLHQYRLELTTMPSSDYHLQNQNYNDGDIRGMLKVLMCQCLDTLPHKEDVIVFLLHWVEDIGYLWNRILAAAIGWSLLTPNQASTPVRQFITAATGTVLFLAVAYFLRDYKRRIQNDVLLELRDNKQRLKAKGGDSFEEDGELLKNIARNKQKLVFYDQMQATYDLAFCVSVSYSWESFLVILCGNILGTAAFPRFLSHFILTIFIAVVFSQFGLELVDLKRQRMKEAKKAKTEKKRKTRTEFIEESRDSVALQMSERQSTKQTYGDPQQVTNNSLIAP